MTEVGAGVWGSCWDPVLALIESSLRVYTLAGHLKVIRFFIFELFDDSFRLIVFEPVQILLLSCPPPPSPSSLIHPALVYRSLLSRRAMHQVHSGGFIRVYVGRRW